MQELQLELKVFYGACTSPFLSPLLFARHYSLDRSRRVNASSSAFFSVALFVRVFISVTSATSSSLSRRRRPPRSLAQLIFASSVAAGSVIALTTILNSGSG